MSRAGSNGRQESSASDPCLIEDLSDLPMGKVEKISSGGYVSAAITSENDLYTWGGRPGQPKLLEQLESLPTPVDLDGKDFLDVAVGNDHIIALTTDGKLFAAGAGRNGQLGMTVERLEDWTEIDVPLKDGQKIVALHAGYKTSILIVKDIT